MEGHLTHDELKAMAIYLVEELYQNTLKVMEAELTVENYSEQMVRIERYKQIHRH